MRAVCFPPASLSLPLIMLFCLAKPLFLLRWIQDEGSGRGEVHERGWKPGECTQPGEPSERDAHTKTLTHKHTHIHTNPCTDSPSSTHRLRPFSDSSPTQVNRLAFVSKGSAISSHIHTYCALHKCKTSHKHTRRWRQLAGVYGMWRLLGWLPPAKPWGLKHCKVLYCYWWSTKSLGITCKIM